MLLAAIFGSAGVLTAQDFHLRNISSVSSLNQRLPSFNTSFPTADSLTISALFELEIDSLNYSKATLLEAEIQALSKDYGLNIQAGFSSRVNEMDWNDSYAAASEGRMRLGFSWDVFNNGLLRNSRKIKQLSNEQEIERLQNIDSKKDLQYFIRYNAIVYSFNKVQIDLLEQRILFLQEKLAILRDLYYAHQIPYREIIQTESRISQNASQLERCQMFNAYINEHLPLPDSISQLGPLQYPLLSLDLDSLEVYQIDEAMISSIKTLQKENVILAAQLEKKLRLSAFARMNITYAGSEGYNTFPTYGATFSMPLNFNKKENQKLLKLKQEEIDHYWQLQSLNTSNEIINYHYEYKAKEKQYRRLSYDIQHELNNWKRSELKMRQAVVVNDLLSPVLAFENILEIQFEQFELKQQMYLLLLKIYTSSSASDIMQLADYAIDPARKKKHLLKRSSFFSLKNFPKTEDEFLSAYIKHNEIEHLYIEKEELNAIYNKFSWKTLSADSINLFGRLNTLVSHLDTTGTISYPVLHAYVKELAISGAHGILLEFDERELTYLKKAELDVGAFLHNTISSTHFLAETFGLKIHLAMPASFLDHLNHDALELISQLVIDIDPEEFHDLKKELQLKTAILVSTTALVDRASLERQLARLASINRLSSVCLDAFEHLFSADWTNLKGIQLSSSK